ncbi:unannotated protein [freshwater metagenome]|uniref:Unannotated protein n=1 Tax=freshwater metagenome TaxID=449393 RepID=A0A6J7M1M2_9ZZZZ
MGTGTVLQWASKGGNGLERANFLALVTYLSVISGLGGWSVTAEAEHGQGDECVG